MKLYQLLSSGAGSVIAQAAKLQRKQEAQALVNKVKLEVAQRAEAYERSMLANIDEYYGKDARKTLALAELYMKRYPKSCVKALVETIITEQKDLIAEQKARVVRRTEVKKLQLSHQGLPIVTALPAEWGRA